MVWKSNVNMIFALHNFSSIFFLCLCLTLALASDGDRSPFYQNCVKSCTSGNCTQDGVKFKKTAGAQQDIFSHLMQWNCKDECRYHCMWLTVNGFRERGYPTPKFHGKWPFIKVFGAQEPAAAFSSLLNLFAHVYMYMKLRKQYSKYNTPLATFWNLFAWVCMNAWIWSTIFHTRDTPFTEFMDYACALSMVVALFVAAIVRLFYGRTYITSTILIATFVYYVNHVSYLYTGDIDYGYNIAVNIVIGVVGAILWTWWALYQRARYSWRLLAFLGFSAVLLSLEILDFPPYADTWDAHALWHLTTAPLPLLFYRFVMDDLNYLRTFWPTLKSNIKLP